MSTQHTGMNEKYHACRFTTVAATNCAYKPAALWNTWASPIQPKTYKHKLNVMPLSLQYSQSTLINSCRHKYNYPLAKVKNVLLFCCKFPAAVWQLAAHTMLLSYLHHPTCKMFFSHPCFLT